MGGVKTGMINVLFGLMALGFAIYALLSMRSGVVVIRYRAIKRVDDPVGFKVGIGFIWFFAVTLVFAAIVARNVG